MLSAVGWILKMDNKYVNNNNIKIDSLENKHQNSNDSFRLHLCTSDVAPALTEMNSAQKADSKVLAISWIGSKWMDSTVVAYWFSLWNWSGEKSYIWKYAALNNTEQGPHAWSLKRKNNYHFQIYENPQSQIILLIFFIGLQFAQQK